MKLLYDTREFDRSIDNSFSFFTEEIKRLGTKHEFHSSISQEPTTIPLTNLEALKSAKYLSKQTMNTINDYEITLNNFYQANPYSKYKLNINNFEKESSEFSKKLFKKLNLFSKILKSYEKISLKKLANFLNIRNTDRLEIWLLSLTEEFPIRIGRS